MNKLATKGRKKIAAPVATVTDLSGIHRPATPPVPEHLLDAEGAAKQNKNLVGRAGSGLKNKTVKGAQADKIAMKAGQVNKLVTKGMQKDAIYRVSAVGDVVDVGRKLWLEAFFNRAMRLGKRLPNDLYGASAIKPHINSGDWSKMVERLQRAPAAHRWPITNMADGANRQKRKLVNTLLTGNKNTEGVRKTLKDLGYEGMAIGRESNSIDLAGSNRFHRYTNDIIDHLRDAPKMSNSRTPPFDMFR